MSEDACKKMGCVPASFFELQNAFNSHINQEIIDLVWETQVVASLLFAGCKTWRAEAHILHLFVSSRSI